MNLFWLLLLAHIIGDFPLQTDRVFYYKHKTRWGILIHIGLCTATNIVLTLPYLIFPIYWVILLFISLFHIALDRTKIRISKITMSDNSLSFFIDQFLHIGSIFIASIVFYSIYPHADNSISGIWTNIHYIQLLTGFILIIFAIAPVNYFLVNDFYHYLLKKDRPFRNFPSGSERIWGYLERGLIAFAIVFKGWWLLLIPLAIIPRFIFARQNNVYDFGLSVFFSVAIGISLAYFVDINTKL